MSKATRLMDCSPQAVFDVLSDGWTYATWVVGAARIRAVDHDFPAAGTKIDHSVGMWPFLISDETKAVSIDEPHEFELVVAAWPAGEARVHIMCEARGDQTQVTMIEHAISGPAKFLPKPVADAMLHLRNVETLKRLGYLAESGARSEHGPHE